MLQQVPATLLQSKQYFMVFNGTEVQIKQVF
jgi:hypothetical protein